MQFVKITVIFALKKRTAFLFSFRGKNNKINKNNLQVIFVSLALSNRKLQDFKLFSFTNILYQLCKN